MKRDRGGSEDLLTLVDQECLRCGKCVEACPFLKHYGEPGEVARQHRCGRDHCHTAFFCHLCNLCRQVCPKDLPVAEMFLELRRLAVAQGKGGYPEHRRSRRYEKIGRSRLFTGCFLPQGCTTVLFPGCTLPGIRPRETLLLFQALRKRVANLGIVFDCCGKISHDLGRHSIFTDRFTELVERFHARGIMRIITACPSCLQVFQRYGDGLEVELPYGLLGDLPAADARRDESLAMVVHDPCTLRFASADQEAVRQLVQRMGIREVPMGGHRDGTFCCGEGGGASLTRGGAAADWKRARFAAAGDLPIVTYCAGCTVGLGQQRTLHLVDLLFGKQPHRPAGTGSGPFSLLRPYWARVQLIRRMQRLWRQGQL